MESKDIFQKFIGNEQQFSQCMNHDLLHHNFGCKDFYFTIKCLQHIGAANKTLMYRLKKVQDMENDLSKFTVTVAKNDQTHQ